MLQQFYRSGARRQERTDLVILAITSTGTSIAFKAACLDRHWGQKLTSPEGPVLMAQCAGVVFLNGLDRQLPADII
jgi:hypothetical protein